MEPLRSQESEAEDQEVTEMDHDQHDKKDEEENLKEIDQEDDKNDEEMKIDDQERSASGDQTPPIELPGQNTPIVEEFVAAFDEYGEQLGEEVLHNVPDEHQNPPEMQIPISSPAPLVVIEMERSSSEDNSETETRVSEVQVVITEPEEETDEAETEKNEESENEEGIPEIQVVITEPEDQEMDESETKHYGDDEQIYTVTMPEEETDHKNAEEEAMRKYAERGKAVAIEAAPKIEEVAVPIIERNESNNHVDKAILRNMIYFRNRNGYLPSAYNWRFRQFLDDALRITKDWKDKELNLRISYLEDKFYKVCAERSKKANFSFRSDYEAEMFELSRQLWTDPTARAHGHS